MGGDAISLSPKALRFVIEALDFKWAADRKRIELPKLSTGASSDLDNDVRLLEQVRAS